MKKIFIYFISFAIILFVMGFSSVKINATTAVDDNYIRNNGLGRSLNITTSKFASPDQIIIGSNVLNETFLSNLTLVRQNYLRDTIKYQHGTSINTYYEINKMDYENKTSVTGFYKMFIGTIQSSFSSSISSREYERVGQYYYTKSLVTEKFAVALPNYRDNITLYQNNLSSTFHNNLSLLNAGAITYQQFFDMYGTHLIAEAVFGGRIDLNYSVTTIDKHISVDLGSLIKNEIDLGVVGLNVDAVSLQTNVNYNNIRSLTSSNCSINYYAVAVGGSGFSTTTQGNHSTFYNNWLNSVNSAPMIIDYAYQGLVPLWQLVPSNYHNVKNNMQNEFYIYYSQKNQSQAYTRSISTDTYPINRGTYKITDSGRFNQPKDDIYLNNSGFDYNTLYNIGVRKVRLIIYLTVKEDDDGYQYIFIYDGPLKTSKLLSERQFEHGPGYKYTSWETYQFVFDLNLIDIGSSYTIRYGASGAWADDWQNKDLKISYLFY